MAVDAVLNIINISCCKHLTGWLDALRERTLDTSMAGCMHACMNRRRGRGSRLELSCTVKVIKVIQSGFKECWVQGCARSHSACG